MAEQLLESVLSAVEVDRRIPLAAFNDGLLVGSVQVVLFTPSNQPHQADIPKLLVSG